MRNGFASLLVTLMLALSMVTGAVTQGFAHAQPGRAPGPLTEMVICASEGGQSVIVVDSNGTPVDPEKDCCRLPCPDCLTAVAFALPPPLLSVQRAWDAVSMVRIQDRHVFSPTRPAHYQAARGPPAQV